MTLTFYERQQLSTTEVRPPLSDPHALHTRLELHNLCVTHFEPS
jgi:hypothetical protein